MLIVISPAKSLDFTTPLPTSAYSTPAFLTHAEVLINILRKKSPAEIASLMSLSDALASLNVARYAEWSLPFSPDNARPAVFAFNGDVYEGLAASSLTEPALAFAQAHLRILSGLYGLLRPLDLIQAYRLEMGTRLKNRRGETLYDFWGDVITQALADEMRSLADQGEASVLVNLASEEYFKSVRPKKLPARVVTPVFEDGKGGVYKQISFYAKRARGLMSRYAVSHALTEVEDLKAFDVEGYAFCSAASAGERWVFRRNLVEK